MRSCRACGRRTCSRRCWARDCLDRTRIYLDQELQFQHPFVPGDLVTATVNVREKRADKRIVHLDTRCTNKHGDVVLLGVATVIASAEPVTWSRRAHPDVSVRQHDRYRVHPRSPSAAFAAHGHRASLFPGSDRSRDRGPQRGNDRPRVDRTGSKDQGRHGTGADESRRGGDRRGRVQPCDRGACRGNGRHGRGGHANEEQPANERTARGDRETTSGCASNGALATRIQWRSRLIQGTRSSPPPRSMSRPCLSRNAISTRTRSEHDRPTAPAGHRNAARGRARRGGDRESRGSDRDGGARPDARRWATPARLRQRHQPEAARTWASSRRVRAGRTSCPYPT